MAGVVTARMRPTGGARHGWRGVSFAALGLACGLLSAGAVQPAFAIQNKPFVAPVQTTPPKGTEAHVDASRIDYDQKRKIATATGRVRLTYGPYVLVASRVVYDEVRNTFSANGSVVLSEPNGNRLLATQVEISNGFKEGFARHLKALLTNDVTLAARYARRYENGITVFEESHYTACANCATAKGDPLWEIVADETVHDQNSHTLRHKNPKLKIAGHTVAWLPYAEHADPSVKRRTGWLIPSASSGNTYGLGVTTPYFWALAPNYDLTFSPLWTTRQGPVADVEWRHRLATGQYNIRGYGVHQFRNVRAPGDGTWRGAVETTGDFALNQDWHYGWDATLQSDRKFLDDYDFNDDDLITSEAHVTGLWDRTYVSAQALAFQTTVLDEDQNRMPVAVPYINGDHTFADPVMGGELGLSWSFYRLERDTAYSPFAEVAHGTSQSRGVANVHWQKQLITQGGLVATPFASLRGDMHVSNNLPDPLVPGLTSDEQTSVRVLPTSGLDLRWPFIGSFADGQSVVTPVFQVIAAANETNRDKFGNEDAITLNFDHSSLFLEDRFTGLDRYEGGSRINAGLTWTFLGNNGGFLRAAAGESFHIGGTNSFTSTSGLEGGKSDLVGAITFQPWENLGLSYEARVEEDLSDINRQEAYLSLTFDRFSGSFGYIDIDAEPAYGRLTRQRMAGAEAHYRLAGNWSLFGGLNYDFIEERFQSRSLGVEFDCDCMNVKLSYEASDSLDTNQTDHRIKASIDLATLGGTSVSAGF